MDVDTPPLDADSAEDHDRLDERWRFDHTEVAGDEEDRNLIDDFEARYIPISCEIFSALIGFNLLDTCSDE